MRRISVQLFALLATLATGCSSSGGKEPGQAKKSEPATVGAPGAAVDNHRIVAADPASQDAKDFIDHLATVNLAEIDLGKLAADRGTADEVKKFARMMIDDHAASLDKVKALASDLKIEAPSQLADKHKDRTDALAGRQGASFDREYASVMVDDHKDLIDQLEPRIDKKTLEQWKIGMNGKAATGGSIPILADPSDNPTTMRIHQLAADLYPTVHAHLAAAKALESVLKQRQPKA